MPAEPPEPAVSAGASALYGPEYYASHCGSIPYDRSQEQWARFFGSIADELIRIFRPARVFDAGCAHGFLVEALWDRGVQAWGRDISEFAISQVRADIRQYCTVGSLTEPIEGRYDLIVCIEVLEHMTEAEAERAVANMTAVTDRIVFSSSPDDFTEPTHVNVNPPIYWLRLFAAHGFAPILTVTLSSITPYTLAFERSDRGRDERDLIVCAEFVRHRLELSQLNWRISQRDRVIEELRREFEIERKAYETVLSSTSWRMTAPLRATIDRLPSAIGQSLRGWVRRGLKFLWWCATFQIVDRVKERNRSKHAPRSDRDASLV